MKAPLIQLAHAFLFFALVVAASPRARAAEDDLAKEILNATGVRGGLIVYLGEGNGKLAAALRANDSYQVHALCKDGQSVKEARDSIRKQGVYGDVAVDRLDGNTLPYVDNLVNLVVAEESGDVSSEEIMRVLVPGGVAYVQQGGRWEKTVKPRPEEIDEWTHYLHEADGNAVAHDSVVGPPRHLQWLGSPRWSRHHDRMASMTSMVSSGGRTFYIMDEGSRVSIQMPSKWKLIARDAFNGTVLWKRDIPVWHNHLWPLKSGPTQLARRLIALEGRVYVTLGLGTPLVALDAATGETLQTYAGSAGTEELLHSDGLLLALVHPGEVELVDYSPEHNVGDQKRVRENFFWDEEPRILFAYDKSTGELRWQKESKVSPLSLCADGERVCFYDGEKLVCLNQKSGEELWSGKAGRKPFITYNFGPRVVLHDGIVLFAGGDRTMRGIDAQSGEILWTAPHDQSGYQSPEDLLVIGGMVWSAPTTSTGDSGALTGRDPKTGEVKVEFPPDVNTYWFHHRCYIAKATDRFLIPSRTGVEFVDLAEKTWDIHHWVRGGCLYGVMPANGLLYAPPHNCACYPEAKIYGLNALAPGSESRDALNELVEAGRLEKGPAFGADGNGASPIGWATFRGDSARRGMTEEGVSPDLKGRWEAEIGGRLSAVTIGEGKLFVAQIDAHTLHALNQKNGRPDWSYTTGGRIDSPPTIAGGQVYFGSADGWLYCLRAEDGELAWRFRGAPRDLRLCAFEQLESVWPIHGSVLVENGAVSFVAGRSSFLDGGMRLIRLDAGTGELLGETIMNEKNPETGGDIQDELAILQMPVGLPDILSSDGEFTYMRSQRFDKEGKRLDLGPVSGQAAEQGAAQSGEGRHLFAPMGFLDDTWFHRAYWVYGKNYAGGHNGYYQAAKYTPAGRILTMDDENVYGYGRKPEYLRWTTTMEHQLYSAPLDVPDAPEPASGPSMATFDNSDSLDPTGKPLAVEAWVKAAQPNGAILSRGGPANGYALIVQGGKPQFLVRSGGEIYTAAAKGGIRGEWAHVAGVLSKDGKLTVYINGEPAGAGDGKLIPSVPLQTMEIGADDKGAVGDYKSPFSFTGLIDDVRLWHGEVTAEEIKSRASDASAAPAGAELVLHINFDKQNARDASGKRNHGKLSGAALVEGKIGGAARFSGRGGGAAAADSYVKREWNRDVPIYVKAIVKAGDTLFIAGPPDLIDEEETFQEIVARSPEVQKRLAEQDEALEGGIGGRLIAVSAATGETLSEQTLTSLPVWDSFAAGGGRLFFTTQDGKVMCLGE